MRLSNVYSVGRYRNKETLKVVNVKSGRRVGRSVDVLFYLLKGKRVVINDREFYSDTWELVEK